MLAVMLAALMSSLTSIFNSASTLFTIDIYTRIRRNASEIEQVIAGRLFVIFMVAVSIVWIPIINSSSSSQLFVYIQSITSYLAPPICAIYVIAVFWPRANEQGAFWGIMIGLVIGMIRFAIEFSYKVPPCGSDLPDLRPDWVKTVVFDVHFLHFGAILFVIVSTCVVVISLLTEPIPEECLHRLTFWTRHSTAPRAPLPSTLLEEEKHPIREQGTAQSTTAPPSVPRRIFNMVCGAEQTSGEAPVNPRDKMTEAERAAADAASLYEQPRQRTFVNVLAMLTMAVAVGMYTYYR